MKRALPWLARCLGWMSPNSCSSVAEWGFYPFASKSLDLRRAEALSALDGVLGPETTLFVASALTPDRDPIPLGGVGDIWVFRKG